MDKMNFSTERKEVARQVKNARVAERLDEEESFERYITHRTGKDYLYRMGGLKHFFEYLRKLKSNNILDIGSGSGNAIHKISQMPLSAGFEFEVTALHGDPNLTKLFPKQNIHITSAESLRGILPESIASVLGMYSIAYSASPEMVVKRINEVLIPGGVLKATFASIGEVEKYGASVCNDPTSFKKILEGLGYDVMIVNSSFIVEVSPSITRDFANSIMIAIKPGNPSAPSAEKLLKLDMEELKNEAVREEDGFLVLDIKE